MGFGSAKDRRFRTRAACATTWSARSRSCKSPSCAGPAAASPTSTTGATALAHATSWGGVDSNAFGTHEFLDLCDMLGADAYVNGNVGSGTPQEIMDWIEYMTS